MERPTHLETTSLGAALAAGAAVGVYDAATLLDEPLGDSVQRFTPKMTATEAQRRHRCWIKAVERSLDLADLHGVECD